ncbi:glycosyl transferase [Marinithermofilum abyssi]|uniref:Glycosyl transferase n=2 Tax=Marinithermofilum abyssi TaxID=1571185 RepID=A0A8J2YBL3_9BACL|nr:glycosyl transferase [Marinithermofilum abyssi]
MTETERGPTMAEKVMIMSSVHIYNDSRILHKQAVSLARAGYDVELHALADFGEKWIQGVKVVGLRPHRSKWERLVNGWRLYRRALSSGADRFHFHDPELLPWGWLLKRKTRSSVIYDAHEDLPKQIHTKPWIPKPMRSPLSRLVHRVEKGLAKSLSAVVTATESIARQFTDAGVRRVEVIKNYPLPMEVEPAGERDEVNRILYVGGISYLRGYKEMIEMMDHLPKELEAELHLIGPLQHIREEDRDEERLREKKVFLHGRIPFEEVKGWLSKGKVGLVCLHPIENYRESLPIKLFEYMAAGLPVVATDFPLWREIVTGSDCGLMTDPLNPEEMAEKVARILQDPERREEMAEHGRRAHREIYNWQVEEKKLLQLYQELSGE